MNKINNGALDMVAISLATLKSADVGDWLVIVAEDSDTVFEVTERVAKRGRNGWTTVSLRSLRTDAVLELPCTHTLPDGITFVGKVSRGINDRTARKLAGEGEETAESNKRAKRQNDRLALETSLLLAEVRDMSAEMLPDSEK